MCVWTFGAFEGIVQGGGVLYESGSEPEQRDPALVELLERR